MFLAELHSEEREAFLELANLIAAIDGNRSIFEESIVNKYKKEMDLEDYQLKGLAMEDILKKFKSERSKNIVLAELFQLIYSDGVFHEQESESIRIIKEYFGFNSKEFASFKDWIDKIKELSL
ncbi:TerB family tellurite resistance protein [Neobacillus niacini]|uniref:TerB family tellurite resistance protein n=1 Tax=Neobacillus niacini TaxID=86668 RepID=UPI002863C932|nr:TerB family tellurite resistance protein [Neobacillus niacini]MDR7002598.1 putative tellurite resistance protein B-like protein [Neobacillus niacini]